ncbi:MAG: catechol 2,3-dioxygenase-like lactoylglutathione lyase family enzyme [Alphaproteobacteria bacterium]|jgi:catechol 2,3-dioxygenase-like lactoylglutathione lyase family enzyme
MSGIHASGISHVVVEVANMARSQGFYGDILGISGDAKAGWPDADGLALTLPSGQHLVFVEAAGPRCYADTGVHQAYRASKPAIAAITARAEAAGITIARYIEDRPEEVADNVYLADPDGNRIQLVVGDGPDAGIGGIDHAAVQVSDIEWEDDFWGEALGVPAVHRTGWNTADYLRARDWGEGKEDMAPGTRRWDQRYRDIPGAKPGQGRKVARPNPQIFFDLSGADGKAVLGIYLAQAHFPEPLPEMTRGTPRIGFTVEDGALDGIAAALGKIAGGRIDGPVTHTGAVLARSVYLRDPCGVFIEFCSLA